MVSPFGHLLPAYRAHPAPGDITDRQRPPAAHLQLVPFLRSGVHTPSLRPPRTNRLRCPLAVSSPRRIATGASTSRTSPPTGFGAAVPTGPNRHELTIEERFGSSSGTGDSKFNRLGLSPLLAGNGYSLPSNRQNAPMVQICRLNHLITG